MDVRIIGAERSAPQRSSLADTAYEALRQQLLTLDIRPGDPLNDAALAEGLGMGRTPVREALKRLEVDKLVVSYPKRGTFATRVEITDLVYVSEIRMQLEPMAASRAARVATAATRAELAGIQEQLRSFDIEHASVTEILTCDSTVHRAVYRAAGNPYLEDTLVRYNNLATRIWCMVIDRLPRLAEHVQEHIQLLQDIIDGDADQASALARHHVEGFEAAVRAALFAA